MKCTDFDVKLVLINIMKIVNIQDFQYDQSFHDVQIMFSPCDGSEFLHILIEPIIY